MAVSDQDLHVDSFSFTFSVTGQTRSLMRNFIRRQAV